MSHDPDSASSGGAGLSGRDLVGLGGFLVGAVVAGTLLGLLLDHALDSSPAFTLIGIGLGMVSAAVGFWLRIRTAMRT